MEYRYDSTSQVACTCTPVKSQGNSLYEMDMPYVLELWRRVKGPLRAILFQPAEFEPIFGGKSRLRAHAQRDTSGLGINTVFVTSFGGKSGWHTR